MIRLLVLIFVTTLPPAAISATSNYWFTPDQIAQGRTLFRQHCAACHGHNAESTADWKQRDAQGRYPPPPLNGSAHAWHHSLDTLRLSIREGGQKLGGWMPPFEHILDARQIDSIIAFFQSLWPEPTYAGWAKTYAVKAHSPVNLEFLQKHLGAVDIGTPQPTRNADIFEIRVNGKTLYISRDGEFAFIGDMIDLKQGINLSRQK